MNQTNDKVRTDVIVIGAGISGIATAKCLRDAGFEVIVLERTGDVGGLWTFREKGYGVMRFTHINVSKHNYCFSDFPFPDDAPDFPHNQQMTEYIHSYVKHFNIDKLIHFGKHVKDLRKTDGGWEVETLDATEDEKGTVTLAEKSSIYTAKFVAIATGHHAKPVWPNFPGQDTFKGELIHSVDYNDAHTNQLEGKRVVIVGIGNSAVDVACHQASVGRSPEVLVSSRSGAWIIPNYVFGRPVDHYACRFFLNLPWQIGTFVLETVNKMIYGHPNNWGLYPKMKALQTQPTVSPTLIHHLQRKNIRIVPNIKELDGHKVIFTDGTSTETDALICCTGYKIDLPFPSESLRKQIMDEKTNSIKLYKNVFSPYVGPTLAFIGFVQPASGGVLSMSEMQARWFTEVCRGKVNVPSIGRMLWDIRQDEDVNAARYFKSSRHTIQRDPILYNDEIAEFIGVKPCLTKHPQLAWQLLFSSCGSAQWRLQGPGRWSGAERAVRKVPTPEFLHYSGILLVLLAVYLFYFFVTFLLNFIFS